MPRIKHGEAGNYHGIGRTKEYAAWRNMKARCYSPTYRSFHRYGGRGIKVCERWMNNYPAFLEDMNRCPQGRTLERIDNDKDYGPSNCRWATTKDQALNTCRTKDLTGTVVGKLVVLSRINHPTSMKRGKPRLCWLCVCDCGTMTVVMHTNLVDSRTTSCGCVARNFGFLPHPCRVEPDDKFRYASASALSE